MKYKNQQPMLKLSLKICILLFINLLNLNNCYSQIGVGTTDPDKSAILEIKSDSKGFLLPRIIDLSLIINPAKGLLVYGINQKCILVFNGLHWVNLCTTQGVVEQLQLTNNMIVDSVLGGSIFSAEFLIDEQDKTFVNNLKPESKSWKPHYNIDNGPYHIYFNLQSIHQIQQIGLHDMHNIDNLEVSYGTPGNWIPLFTEPCDGYQVWKIHEVDIKTQYIRFSMYESAYASINEINIFGFSTGLIHP